MRVVKHLIAATALFVALPTLAADPVPPATDLIEGGVNAYLAGDARDALEFWLKGSVLEGNPETLKQARDLAQIEDYYGKPVGFDVVTEQEAGPRVRVIYLTINYEKGVAFGVFQVYRDPAGQWVTIHFNFNTDALDIFPSCLFSQ